MIVNNPKIEFTTERTEGISAFMRIKNGEEFLESSIKSILLQVDEIICVYNDCSDNTELILHRLREEHPDIIKIYKYVPKVFPPNSEMYISLPETHPQSLVHYYNFALSKTTKTIVFKMDDDECFFPNILRELTKEVDEKTCVGLRGINLLDHNKKLYINKNEFKTGGGDTLLFKFNPTCKFKKSNNFEVFSHNLSVKRVYESFYHLKRCKKDRGINNYNLEKNKNSRYNEITFNFFKNLDLLEIKNRPEEIGFKIWNESKKEYNSKEIEKLENLIQESIARNNK